MPRPKQRGRGLGWLRASGGRRGFFLGESQQEESSDSSSDDEQSRGSDRRPASAVSSSGFLELAGLVEDPGVFAVTGTASELPAVPLLRVAGLDEPLSTPILQAQAQALVARADKAKFGKGAETVQDDTVRCGFTVPGRHVSFGCGKTVWDEALAKLVDRVQKDLGVVSPHVDAQLHDLLVYGPGGHFSRHKDSVKAPGMFGTLVVALPCCHAGGELVVRHKDLKPVVLDSAFSAAGAALCGPARFAAFYADCEHEVLPVTEGHRVVLTYNLVRTDIKHDPLALKSAAVPPSQGSPARRMADFARRWADPGEELFKHALLCHFLDHEYVEDIDWKDLNCRDAAVANTMAESQGFDMYLVTVVLTAEGDEEAGSHTYDTTQFSGWVPHESNVSGMPTELPRIDVIEGDYVQGDGYMTRNRSPDDEERTGFTGNEGAPFKKWYRSAAIVFWPRETRARVLGTEVVLTMLEATDGPSAADKLQLARSLCTAPPPRESGSVEARLLMALAESALPLADYESFVSSRLDLGRLMDPAPGSPGAGKVDWQRATRGCSRPGEDQAQAPENQARIGAALLSAAERARSGSPQAVWMLAKQVKGHLPAASLYDPLVDMGLASLAKPSATARNSAGETLECALSVLINDAVVPEQSDASGARALQRLEVAVESADANPAHFDPLQSLPRAIAPLLGRRSSPLLSTLSTQQQRELQRQALILVERLASRATLVSRSAAVAKHLTGFDLRQWKDLLTLLAATTLDATDGAKLALHCSEPGVVIPAVALAVFPGKPGDTVSEPSDRIFRGKAGLLQFVLRALKDTAGRAARANAYNAGRRAYAYYQCKTMAMSPMVVPPVGTYREASLEDAVHLAVLTVNKLDDDRGVHVARQARKENVSSSSSSSSKAPSTEPLCVHVVKMIESNLTLFDPVTVLAPATRRLALFAAQPDQCAAEQRERLQLALEPLSALTLAKLRDKARPLPPLKDWALPPTIRVPASSQCSYRCQCQAVNTFLASPTHTEKSFSGPEATWTGHLTLALEQLAEQSGGAIQVKRLSTKAAKKRGAVQVVKAGEGRAPPSQIQKRQGELADQKHVRSVLAALEAAMAKLLKRTIAATSTTSAAASGAKLQTMSGTKRTIAATSTTSTAPSSSPVLKKPKKSSSNVVDLTLD